MAPAYESEIEEIEEPVNIYNYQNTPENRSWAEGCVRRKVCSEHQRNC
ncbi:unnamed protein product [Tuber melanosporum]|uniref:(Perigord truffle) hypothetical protein n=1 Tax=Tuber melanosporum (strain Mel28) TaxID=656061 RepID=D5G7G4_TUBMM|nr:uncharacterized protein GSTUM_00002452001 [Tuber melanosporum]CAZ80457.1 unnamed protein product [Tuber melanosporum]